jgi:hypothetical protein
MEKIVSKRNTQQDATGGGGNLMFHCGRDKNGEYINLTG